MDFTQNKTAVFLKDTGKEMKSKLDEILYMKILYVSGKECISKINEDLLQISTEKLNCNKKLGRMLEWTLHK